MALFLMWMIYTQHQESKPTFTLMFSPLKCVPLSLNAYTQAQSQSFPAKTRLYGFQ